MVMKIESVALVMELEYVASTMEMKCVTLCDDRDGVLWHW